MMKKVKEAMESFIKAAGLLMNDGESVLCRFCQEQFRSADTFADHLLSCRPLPQFKYLYDMYRQDYLLADEAAARR